MSFIAKMELDGEALNVLHCSYRFIEATDSTGRPTSIPRGGAINLVLESSNNNSLFDWMIDPLQTKSGVIIFYRRDAQRTLNRLEFSDAYCVDYYETFDHQSSDPMQVQLVINATSLKLNGSEYPGGREVEENKEDTNKQTVEVRPNVYVPNNIKEIDNEESEIEKHALSAVEKIDAIDIGLRTVDDPARDYYGSGLESHPAEWKEIIEHLKREGVEIVYRENTLAYSPVREGPGQMILDPEASFSALKHEYQHFLDDKASGYKGLRHYLENAKERYALEESAYEVEINMAKENGNRELVVKLQDLKQNEFNKLFGKP